MIGLGGKSLLFDPFISPNEMAKAVDIKTILPDYILVTHGHEDHTADLLTIARQSNATLISIYEIYAWMMKQGYSQGHPMNIGGKKTFDFGTVKLVPALHSSSFGDGSYAGLAAGFIIKAEGKTIYFAGDTALSQEMKWIGEFDRPDHAFLPIGGNFTMDHEDAAVAANLIGCSNIIGMHYDTFGFIKIDRQKAVDHFRSKNKTLTLLQINQSIEI
jgi:L-ascorbate metabolism protein UlaG (beta-lactamase superfamily)